MKLLPSHFSCVYNRVKLFAFAMNSRRSYSIFECFFYGLEEKNSKSLVLFDVCRLPSAINVMRNLSIINYTFLFQYNYNPSRTLSEFRAIYLDLTECQMSFFQGMEHMGFT